jgi:hypothetical protein
MRVWLCGAPCTHDPRFAFMMQRLIATACLVSTDALFHVSRDWETALAQHAVRAAMVTSALELLNDVPVVARAGGGGGGGGDAGVRRSFSEALDAMVQRPDDGCEYALPGGKYVPLMARPRGGVRAMPGP